MKEQCTSLHNYDTHLCNTMSSNQSLGLDHFVVHCQQTAVVSVSLQTIVGQTLKTVILSWLQSDGCRGTLQTSLKGNNFVDISTRCSGCLRAKVKTIRTSGGSVWKKCFSYLIYKEFLQCISITWNSVWYSGLLCVSLIGF